MSKGILQKFSSLVVLPHSIFALPFASSSALLAINRGNMVQSGKSLGLVFLVIILAVISARTAAMGLNRIVDVEFDKLNPRTQSRELVTGELKQSTVWYLIILSSGVFFLCAGVLGKHCLILSPLVLLLLFFYSYSKRFTRYSHLILGLALAAAPGGAWWVFRPVIEVTPILLMLAVLFWVGGFDILYSCQDENFDRDHKLYSIPATLGIQASLKIAKLLHLTALIMFFSVGISANLTLNYYFAVLILSIPLFLQHKTISPTDLRKINRTFFTYNGMISLLYFFVILLLS